MRASEVLIVGAGPFGLSISTHLRARAIDHVIVGRPMDTWRAHMPAGMYLKSEPYGSDMSSPQRGYDLAGYSQAERVEGIERGEPLSIDRFLAYADWYIRQLVPDVIDATVTAINSVDGGFEVAFADAEPIAARKVVVATGVLPHSYLPAELSGLPSELVSHTADHHQFGRFKGRRLAIVGAGSSALETAALAHEAGAEVQLVVRCPDSPVWGSRALPLTTLRQLRNNKLCEGWKCPFWNSPSAFRRLPPRVRLDKARTVLGPLGAWWLRDRVEGVVEMIRETQVRGAETSGTGVRLLLSGPSGRSSIVVDHVIAGTGFRIDLARLSCLSAEVRAQVASVDGYPVVTRAAESTVPGLYFVGAPAAFSLGPSMRFIAGTHNVARQLTRSVARGVPSADRSAIAKPRDDTAIQETA
jgi:FAD-dependent urate hydroxylase